MELRRLKIAGFRSLKEAEWFPGKLNILIGPNASGKSNLLGAIELTSALAEGKASAYVELCGGFYSMIWDGSARGVSIQSEFASITNSPWPLRLLEYSLGLKRAGRLNDHAVSEEWVLARAYGSEDVDSPTPLLERTRDRMVIVDSESGDFVDASDSTVSPRESLLSEMKGPFGKNSVLDALRTDVSSWRVYQVFDTRRDAKMRQPTVTRFEKSLTAYGDNLPSVLHTLYGEGRKFKNEIDRAMASAFGERYQELFFPAASEQRIQLGVRWRDLENVAIAPHLSDGTLRFLALMAVLLNPDPPALIAIDEPDVGLHPDMFPVLAECAEIAAERTQVVFTTHSADLLDCFRRTQPTVTIAEIEDGGTRLRNVAGDDLKTWIEEYRLGESFRSGEMEALS